MMTIRSGWRTSDVIAWSALVGMFVAFAVIWPSQAGTYLTGPVLIGLVIWVRMRAIRLEIGESAVRARQGRWRGQRDGQVPRSKVRSIHYFPRMISFRGPNNTPIMKIMSNYNLRQLRKVATELKVPLYDHTRWYGLREAREGIGQLVYKPETGQPVSRPG